MSEEIDIFMACLFMLNSDDRKLGAKNYETELGDVKVTVFQQFILKVFKHEINKLFPVEDELVYSLIKINAIFRKI